MRKGAQTLVFESKPVILSRAAIGGKKEGEGPLAAHFDFLGKDAKLGQKTFEKAESKLQELALDTAKRKLGISYEDIDVLFAGDLLNQCISSSFAARGTSIPFLGLYGACSTMAESLLLAAAFVDAGFADTAAALTSSHFASAERQYRFPLGYGGQRTPTSQWTVTGSGCCIVGKSGHGPRIEAATIGKIQDYGIKDANNMGAAMAPAAIDTMQAHFRDLRRVPSDYDLIVTGDLGMLGKTIVLDQFRRIGVDLSSVYNDCGLLIFDTKKQDVHAGGSGCGCGASVLCGYLLDKLENGNCGGFCSAQRARCSPPRPAGRANRFPACVTRSPSRRKECNDGLSESISRRWSDLHARADSDRQNKAYACADSGVLCGTGRRLRRRRRL